MFLQSLALKAGLATTRDLAQVSFSKNYVQAVNIWKLVANLVIFEKACRDSYSTPVVYSLWFIAEVAIAATDLAEVIGSAVALQLLFGLPLIAGVCVTALDVLLLLFMHGRRFRVLEGFVGLLILLITGCFAAQLGMAKPDAIPLLQGFIPVGDI